MQIETGDFPIVRMAYGRADPMSARAGIEALEALVAGGRPFVIICTREGDEQRDVDEHQGLSSWMQQNRAQLRRWVRAMVYVEQNRAIRFSAETSSSAFSEVWGFPVIVAASHEDGRMIAARLLAGMDAGQAACHSTADRVARGSGDVEFYSRREREERTLADQTDNPAVASIHRRLAHASSQKLTLLQAD